MSRVVLFGQSDFARVNRYYLTHDSPCEVVAYTVDGGHIAAAMLDDLPVVPFEELVSRYPPDRFALAIPVGPRRVNHLRAEKYAEAKSWGYRLISYVSSKAVTWPDLVLGENCFVYEGAVVKPFVDIGDNVIVEAGCVIGHHTVVGDHSFLATNATINSHVSIGAHTVVGAGAVVRDGATVGEACIIGAGTVVGRDARAHKVYLGNPPQQLPGTSMELSPLFE